MTSFHSLFFILTALTLARGAAVGPVSDLTLFTDVVAPDGEAFSREAVLVSEAGGSVVGPLIRGNKGDTFKLNVINKLSSPNIRQSTSVHWHGILQSGGQNWADGGAFVNQCPIAPQDSFLYEFAEPNQAGTFWYHSHLSSQYCDGLRGPFVIYDPNDAHGSLYDVDDESTVITLSDWYHDYATTLLLPTSDTTLINGRGRHAGAGGTTTQLSVVEVEQGKRYRLRFINIACDPYFTVSIDRHSNLKVIEADGVSTVQVETDSFDIFAGQRYSVVLEANQPVGNYWIRAAPNGVSSFSGGTDMAILRYIGAPEEDPTTSRSRSTNKLQEQSLIPLENPGAPGIHERDAADVVHSFQMGFDGPNLEFLMDGVAFHSPSMPVLLQILSGARTADNLLPEGSFLEINAGDIVELNFPANNIGRVGPPHPIHLHGHVFDVIRSAGSIVDNYTNPPRRDVVSIGGPRDNVTIRFRADNGGPWFLHCHVDWHLEMGFAAIISERTDEWTNSISPPTEWYDLCPKYDALPADQQ